MSSEASWTFPSQLPFGWVCFSNKDMKQDNLPKRARLNCLSAGSVSLTFPEQRERDAEE